MVEKTQGIILHHIKYSDSSIVAWIYTRKYGRQSFLIRGLRKKKSGRHNVFFQPLFILDMDIYYRESRSLHTIKEFHVAYSPASIHSDIKKSTVAIFLGEVLSGVLKEESPNEDLFSFLERSVIYFDKCNERFANFHIAFLAGLSSYLGFEPGLKSGTNDRYFDMMNGSFVAVPSAHGNYANKEISGILAAFFSTSYENINQIPLTGSLRNEVLEILVRYYCLHLPGLKKINSLEVLKEVFS